MRLLLWLVLGRQGSCITIIPQLIAHRMFNMLPWHHWFKLDCSIPLDSKQISMIEQVPVKASFFQLAELSAAQ